MTSAVLLSLICKRSCRIVRLHHTICHFHSTPIMAFPICPIFSLSLSFNNYCAEVAKMFHYEPLEHLTFPVGWRWLINHSTWAILEGFNSYNSLLTIAAIGRTQHTNRKKSALIRVRRIVLFERILKELGDNEKWNGKQPHKFPSPWQPSINQCRGLY